MVSKRTIDYYTSIGLLKAERTKSNYRIYDEESLRDLRFIEECKNLHFPLDEIRRKLELRKAKTVCSLEMEQYIEALSTQVKQLHNDLFDLFPILGDLDEQQKEKLTTDLSLLRAALLKSLLKVSN